jgi:hypothetical protein
MMRRTLTVAEVLEISRLLDRNISIGAIAEEFRVGHKTVARIRTGETWSEVTKRTSTVVTNNTVLPADPILDLMDEAVSVKNHFCLALDRPMDWGYFDWYDGLHSVVTDGYIFWESADLVSLALKLNGGKELPTFWLKDLMTQPIGQVISNNHLPNKYAAIADSMKLELRQAGTRHDIVYLTRSKTKITADTASVVIACVAV